VIGPHPDPTGAESLIGLVPAAGHAIRLGSPSGSKELLPVWLPQGARGGERLPAVHCLLSAFEAASIERTLVVLRNGKEDIRESLGTVTAGGMRLEYVKVEDTPSPPFTLDAAVPRLSDATVTMGFPDILFEPLDAVRRMLASLNRTEADIVLGLFPHPWVRRADVVELEADSLVRAVHSSGDTSSAAWTWGLAAWRPRFTRFLHEYLTRIGATSPGAGRLGVGDVVNAAIENGLGVGGEVVSDTPFLDIGTPDALEEAYRRLRDL